MKDHSVIQVVGYKNSGKTTTVCELISRFSAKGLKIGSIKHDAHHFEVDYPGKDTWLHREAGAVAVAISSKEKSAFMENRPSTLEQLLSQMKHVDLVIVEGYKFANLPKIVLLKEERDIALLEQATSVVAICTWFPYTHHEIPVFSIQDKEGLFTCIQQVLGK